MSRSLNLNFKQYGHIMWSQRWHVKRDGVFKMTLSWYSIKPVLLLFRSRWSGSNIGVCGFIVGLSGHVVSK